MGVSTNAVIFYGYCWKDEDRLFGEDPDTDWEERVLKKRGETNPWDAYPNDEVERLPYDQRRKAGEQWCTDHRAELDAWREKKKAVAAEFGVEPGSHCSGECPMPYVAIVGAGQTSRRGYPESVPDLTVGLDWDTKLNRFLAEFDIEKPHVRPQWWLVSYWG